jgi:hypothetical protein
MVTSSLEQNAQGMDVLLFPQKDPVQPVQIARVQIEI